MAKQFHCPLHARVDQKAATTRDVLSQFVCTSFISALYDLRNYERELRDYKHDRDALTTWFIKGNARNYRS